MAVVDAIRRAAVQRALGSAANLTQKIATGPPALDRKSPREPQEINVLYAFVSKKIIGPRQQDMGIQMVSVLPHARVCAGSLNCFCEGLVDTFRT